MEFSKLVSYAKEFNARKTDLLLVVTSYEGFGFLPGHLALLERQTYLDFNVLLVIGPQFPDGELFSHIASHRYPFGIIVAKETERRGCSGAFFAGQKYALENGYGYITMADDDCMPVDAHLIEELYRHRAKGYVAPTIVWVEDGYRKKGYTATPASYSLLSTDFFRKHGLYYMPLFHGADDIEYMERVRVKPFPIPNKVEHPYIVGMRLFSMFDRAWLFLLQAILIIKNPRATIFNLALLSFMCCAAFSFFPPYGRRLAFAVNRLLLTYTYGKKASDALRSGYEKWIVEMQPRDFAGFEEVNDSDPEYIDRGQAEKLSGLLRRCLGMLNKDVVIEKTHSFAFAFLLAMSARRLYVKIGQGKYLLLADNRSLAMHAAKFLVFAAAIPFQLLCALAFIPVKILRQPDTRRYGLG